MSTEEMNLQELESQFSEQEAFKKRETSSIKRSR